MDGLEAEEYDRQYSDGALVRRILNYFRPDARKMLIAATAIGFVALLDTGIPIFISYSLDQLQVDPATRSLVMITVVLTLLASTSWLFNLVRQTLSAEAVGNVVLRMREDAFDAVVQRDLSFYDQFASGKVVSRVNSDTQQFSQVMVLVMELLSRALLVILLLGYLFTVSVSMTLILVVLAPFIVIAALAFRRIARHTITNSRRMNATVGAHIQETVSGIGVAKTFRQEPAIYAAFERVNEQSRRVNLHMRYVFASIFPILNGLAGIGTALLVYYGGWQVRGGALTAGDWYLFIQGLTLFWFPLTSIASFWSQFQLGLAAGERVFALIDAEPQVVQRDNIAPERVNGDIRFERVDFSYKPDEPVLQDFSLHLQPGEMLALVGHTGSGKSSIAKLVARFYEFQGGRILIDGQDIRELDMAAYRTRLGIVTQAPFLFDGTVRENIRYGSPDATDAEVEVAAQQVGGGDWIATLPQGLDSEVGERGSNLSMGQRQIVALVRVLLQDPAIVILDEATASIDPLTEAMIQEGLDTVLAGRTAIVIAHRLSTIRHADRIIVLRKGAILEEGDHEALLMRGGHYAELYNTYFRHQSLAYIEAAPDPQGSAASPAV
jgi:ABC-type multidrug transport system fused ATPase/permease subunit